MTPSKKDNSLMVISAVSVKTAATHQSPLKDVGYYEKDLEKKST